MPVINTSVHGVKPALMKASLLVSMCAQSERVVAQSMLPLLSLSLLHRNVPNLGRERGREGRSRDVGGGREGGREVGREKGRGREEGREEGREGG